ncbi:hypothetical protein L9F63_005440, partial [Diploptera punctata]
NQAFCEERLLVRPSTKLSENCNSTTNIDRERINDDDDDDDDDDDGNDDDDDGSISVRAMVVSQVQINGSISVRAMVVYQSEQNVQATYSGLVEVRSRLDHPGLILDTKLLEDLSSLTITPS